jgi:hypothetical protein
VSAIPIRTSRTRNAPGTPPGGIADDEILAKLSAVHEGLVRGERSPRAALFGWTMAAVFSAGVWLAVVLLLR